MHTIVGKHWHHLTNDEVFEILGTNAARGLDLLEVKDRQGHFGPNVLTQKKGQGPLVRFLLQFHQPLVYILLLAAVITGILSEWVDSSVIFLVVFLNAMVGFLQESKALRAIDALSRSLSSEALVLRAGKKRRVPALELVPGDIVSLQSGDKVPADLRLFEVKDLKADESALTGESVPVEKAEEKLDRDIPVVDRRNMAYSTSLVTYGVATGVVVATGNLTEIGRISELISSADSLDTPLTLKIKRFSHVILYAILVMAAVTFAIGVARGNDKVETFMAAVALSVAAIPEGLPAAVTIILAMGVSRMAKRRAIVRKLPAVETLGSTNVICSDKTGTLTQNQMTVQEILAGGRRFSVTGTGYAPQGAIEVDGRAVLASEDRSLLGLLECGILCNDSQLIEESGVWKVQGDPTEAALLVVGRKAGLDADQTVRAAPRIDVVPFESHHQYMATLHRTMEGDATRAHVKGSLEKLLPRCTGALLATGEVGPLDADAVLSAAEDMASRALRVLCFARKDFPRETTALKHGSIDSGLVFLGLEAMIDPPRPEAALAVAKCRSAGVRVKMITGDHAATARAIAHAIGIESTDADAPVLTERELTSFDDETLIEAADRTNVFARVTPESKLRLVKALQARGHVVAMTGDGVNDAPALRQANIGVAMGRGGTEVAREAADMVLTDDDFASIEAAVEEGRGVFDNLLKFIAWTLPTNIGEALVLVVAIGLDLSLPLEPIHILWINLTTAVCLGMMLAFEPKESGLMDRPPRAPGSPILGGLIGSRILYVGLLLSGTAFALFAWEEAALGNVREAQTVATTVFIVGEIFYLFNCRSMTRPMSEIGWFTNPWIWIGVAAMLALQALFIYVPVLQRVFQTDAMGFVSWLKVLGAGVAIGLIVAGEKWVRRRIAAR